ncbi:MAG TPA: FecR family protein [Blastocatellia bacterium]|nr:FecR family protein [Blastocatellia bacterium]
MQSHPMLLRLTLIISLLLLVTLDAQAQNDVVQARVRSVTGVARIYINSQSTAFSLKRDFRLDLGNIIETDLNGRVVISLTDGSQITVLPNSKVVLKDFHVAHLARELLDIQLGRVLVKIRSYAGKPNPYRVNSPTASIAVRGTEFIVDVIFGGETLVVVREGQVEVWPHENPNNKRLINPGGRVIVRPGGDISSAFPGPGSELNGRNRFYGNLEDDYQRSVDGVVQNSNEIVPVFYSAFADPHFDSLENPAYAAEFKNAEGRLLLLPSISAPYHSRVVPISKSEDPPSFDYAVSPQMTFFTPIPNSRLVVGGGASALRTRLQDITDYQFSDYQYHDAKTMRLNALNVSLVAAYSFGKRGGTSVGISFDRLSGDGNFNSEYFSRAQPFNEGYISDSNAQFARASVRLGLVHRFSENKKIGLYYRHGVSSSDQETRYDQHYSDQFHTGALISLTGRTKVSNISSEIGVRFRAPLTRRLFYGIEGSYLYERIRSRRAAMNQTIGQNRYLARRARLGGGMGYLLTSKILLNFDVAGGLFYNTEPAENLPGFGFGFFALAPIALKSPRGSFFSTHVAIQTNLWRNLFLSASTLRTLHQELLTYKSRSITYGDSYSYYTQLSNAGIGWNFKPNFSAEYLFSIDHNYRLPSHSLKLRYTFNLSLSGEK